MKTQYDFIKSLKPGDVITTVGVKNATEKTLVNNCGCGGSKLNRYARVVAITASKSDLRPGDDIGVRLEGTYPDCRDMLWHVAREGDQCPPMARKASDAEHTAYMTEYIKFRKQLNAHHMQENKEEAKKLRIELKELKKIATAEKIDINSILET